MRRMEWVSKLGLETDLREIMETYGYPEGWTER